jgi:hypothetical protein
VCTKKKMPGIEWLEQGKYIARAESGDVWLGSCSGGVSVWYPLYAFGN